MTDKERKAEFKILKFTINNTDLTNEVEKYKTISEYKNKDVSVYDYIVVFSRELQGCRSHKVVIEFEYEVPIHDAIQTYKVTKPCKRLEHSVHLDIDNDWVLEAAAFTSFYCKQSDENSSFNLEKSGKKYVRVDFQNWIIPGAGYSVFFKKD